MVCPNKFDYGPAVDFGCPFWRLRRGFESRLMCFIFSLGTFFLGFFSVAESSRARELAETNRCKSTSTLGMLNPTFHPRIQWRHVYTGGGGREEDTCDQGMSRRPPRVKLPTTLSQKVMNVGILILILNRLYTSIQSGMYELS